MHDPKTAIATTGARRARRRGADRAPRGPSLPRRRRRRVVLRRPRDGPRTSAASLPRRRRPRSPPRLQLPLGARVAVAALAAVLAALRPPEPGARLTLPRLVEQRPGGELRRAERQRDNVGPGARSRGLALGATLPVPVLRVRLVGPSPSSKRRGRRKRVVRGALAVRGRSCGGAAPRPHRGAALHRDHGQVALPLAVLVNDEGLDERVPHYDGRALAGLPAQREAPAAGGRVRAHGASLCRSAVRRRGTTSAHPEGNRVRHASFACCASNVRAPWVP